MKHLDRISMDPAQMGGGPCIQGTRVTVGTIGGLVAENRTAEELLEADFYLDRNDIRAALRYAA